MIYSKIRSETKGDSIMENSHSSALMAKHAGLEHKIAVETRRPAPDTALIAELKKRKLRLKEEIAQIQ